MNAEIVKRGAKFYLEDPETGETLGSEKGYPTRQAAQKALMTLESASKLPKSASMPRMAPQSGPSMPPMPPQMAQGGPEGGDGMAKMMEMMKMRGGM